MNLIIKDKNGEILQKVEVNKETAFKDLFEEIGFDKVTFGCMAGACGICKVLVEEGRENVEYFSEPLVIDKNSDEVLTCIAKIKPKTSNLVIKLVL